MIVRETPLSGAFVVDVEPAQDARGLFARTFDRETFAAHGLAVTIDQVSVSYNERAGTLRGMHYQADPHGEEKLVRCVRGAIHDVIVDLRPDSPTLKQSFGIDLDEDSRTALYIPKGMAHGFLTLTDAAEVLYLISTPYVPDAARGVRWDDPAFGIDWPGSPQVMSDRDRTYPDFQP
ncbi:dTDP-4-dehydrorhamnose 3,5-epimerase family protein [Solirubrobacter taibaiensis]|nr:dTDP-4-dehydrorhamnose 3,5-epimerase family protein [Solirubrobacter taibaiensis]